ncbi:MAG: DUF962 domain-containing protein [Alphaproteobacteria bacterium]|nr:DUF962 domain-containing protein [Alphaproteobacteria bacterium]MCB9797823.1 DUF962 domain-containing protein [Alphaproteobacteria bacterium]
MRRFADFWPYYLGQHSHPRCRAAHFTGTTLSLGLLALAGALEPQRMALALAVAGTSLVLGALLLERRWPALPALLIAFGALAWVHPLLAVASLASGYSFAWLGHFAIEGNRPASFTYPVWSFLADLKLWGLMCTGQLWADDVEAWMG